MDIPPSSLHILQACTLNQYCKEGSNKQKLAFCATVILRACAIETIHLTL